MAEGALIRVGAEEMIDSFWCFNQLELMTIGVVTVGRPWFVLNAIHIEWAFVKGDIPEIRVEAAISFRIPVRGRQSGASRKTQQVATFQYPSNWVIATESLHFREYSSAHRRRR
jgi:hypothetical protein